MSVFLEDFEIEELREKLSKELRTGNWSMNSMAIDLNMRPATLKRFVETNYVIRLRSLMKIKNWIDDKEKAPIEPPHEENIKIDILFEDYEIKELRDKAKTLLATGNWTLNSLALEFETTGRVLRNFIRGENNAHYRTVARIKSGICRLEEK